VNAFLRHHIHKLQTVKNGPFFGPPCIICYVILKQKQDETDNLFSDKVFSLIIAEAISEVFKDYIRLPIWLAK